eukprot:CAMPEP_0174702994 /NCGR_PEP_ID=MMETSP1094-20130205/7100_1 /TAXON_ID=156173 /ORGANISM="Chrysochromulina brevifilum, Strain UTEX LB 985" /LENGTH=242 /DNA_ID=CAMNT_0015900855 /DNA_START=238 /DNA_END=969 /DNA_ORIENTATION=+
MRMAACGISDCTLHACVPVCSFCIQMSMMYRIMLRLRISRAELLKQRPRLQAAQERASAGNMRRSLAIDPRTRLPSSSLSSSSSDRRKTAVLPGKHAVILTSEASPRRLKSCSLHRSSSHQTAREIGNGAGGQLACGAPAPSSPDGQGDLGLVGTAACMPHVRNSFESFEKTIADGSAVCAKFAGRRRTVVISAKDGVPIACHQLIDAISEDYGMGSKAAAATFSAGTLSVAATRSAAVDCV